MTWCGSTQAAGNYSHCLCWNEKGEIRITEQPKGRSPASVLWFLSFSLQPSRRIDGKEQRPFIERTFAKPGDPILRCPLAEELSQAARGGQTRITRLACGYDDQIGPPQPLVTLYHDLHVARIQLAIEKGNPADQRVSLLYSSPLEHLAMLVAWQTDRRLRVEFQIARRQQVA